LKSHLCSEHRVETSHILLQTSAKSSLHFHPKLQMMSFLKNSDMSLRKMSVSIIIKCHEVSPSAQLQYHALQSFRCEKYIKMRTSSLVHSVICDTLMQAGNLLLANCLQCQLHKNEIFKGEFCNFNSSKPLLCQVCNPCSLPYYCCRSFFFLENIIKKRWKNAKLHDVEHMD